MMYDNRSSTFCTIFVASAFLYDYVYAIEAATRCNSGAGEAAGAGVESPTVPPETEDGLAERRPWHSVPFRLRQP